MIKVNLLDSVTDRSRSVAVVEERVANPRTRTLMLMACVFTLMLLAMGFEYVSTSSAHAAAQAELERQEQIAKQMESINKEQAELEKKTKDIETRIEAIKKLRASQQGPVGVLSEINSRLPSSDDFRLENIEQKNGELSIEGHSPSQTAVTQFARSLEFSSGVFTNVSMEFERKELEITNMDFDPTLGMPERQEVVKFKVKCRYAPKNPSANNAQPNAGGAKPSTNQIAQK